jgi:hypothetical protein
VIIVWRDRPQGVELDLSAVRATASVVPRAETGGMTGRPQTSTALLHAVGLECADDADTRRRNCR